MLIKDANNLGSGLLKSNLMYLFNYPGVVFKHVRHANVPITNK